MGVRNKTSLYDELVWLNYLNKEDGTYTVEIVGTLATLYYGGRFVTSGNYSTVLTHVTNLANELEKNRAHR